MEEHAEQRPDGASDLAGSRITLLVYDGEGVIASGRNLPEGLSLEAFSALISGNRLSPISGRTFGDIIRSLGLTGGTAREQCDILCEGFAASYDVEMWRRQDGCIGVMLIDVTGSERDSTSVRSLSLELAHRTKNILAVVLSLATQTANRSCDYAEFKQRFFSHVDALSKAHDMVAATGWQGVEMGTVIETCTAPLPTNMVLSISREAHCVSLKANAVQNIAIVIRELQGACKTGDRVSCHIDTARDGALDLSWVCEGRHDRAGLWTDMLCRYAPISLDGLGEIDFREDGFVYHLSIGADQRA